MSKMYEDLRLMLKCCTLYYEKEYSQAEIAKRLNISRPTVSRLLKQAKLEGIIKIQINSPLETECYLLEKQLEEKFNLKEAIIVEDRYNSQNEIEELGHEVCKHLYRVLKEGDKIGVSMGGTLTKISKFANNPTFKNIEFISLVGGVDQSDIQKHSNELVIEFAKSYGGKYKFLHGPAMISDIKIKEALMKDCNIRDTFYSMDSMNVAIVGIGNPMQKNSTILESVHMSDEIKNSFQEKHAVGDICLQVYDIEGNTSIYDFNELVFGFDINKLREVNTVIGIAYGVEKVRSIQGALNGNFINVLATNYEVAKKLLDLSN